MDFGLGELFGGLASGAGSIMGANISAASQQQTNAYNWEIFRQQQLAEKHFSENSIQLRAADARKAGVNVDVALGGPQLGGGVSAPNIQAPDTGQYIANAVSNVGQGIGRMITANQEADEMTKLSIERARLENDLLRSQISVTKTPARQAKLPSPMDSGSRMGQGNAVVVAPSQITASSSGNRGQQAGSINEYQYALGHDGVYRAVPSTDAKERLEDSLPLELDWLIRNRLFTPPPPGPEHQRGANEVWVKKGFGSWAKEKRKSKRYHPKWGYELVD